MSSFETVTQTEYERQRRLHDDPNDDRTQCVCIADHDLKGGGPANYTRCANRTRHITSRCVGCRLQVGSPK